MTRDEAQRRALEAYSGGQTFILKEAARERLTDLLLAVERETLLRAKDFDFDDWKKAIQGVEEQERAIRWREREEKE